MDIFDDKLNAIKETALDNSDTVVAVVGLLAGIASMAGCFYGYYRCIRAGVRDGIKAGVLK